MKITQSNVVKMVITDATMPEGRGMLDPIAVYVEDFGPGQGKITITCFGDAWSHYWSHMGETTKLADFFCSASLDYLVGKLKTGIEAEIDDDDPDALESLLKKEIIKLRREDVLTHQQARDLWNDAIDVDWNERHNVCYEVFGDEWWYRTPKKLNPDYEYLRQIVTAVKAGFAQVKGGAA